MRILRLSSPSCHTLVPQDIFICPPVFRLPPLFPWRLSSQSSAARMLSSTLRFSALPVAATPCGSRYSLGTTQVRGTYAAEAVLLGVGPRRLATVGQRFLFSPSNRVDHFALRLFRSLRFHLPDIVRVLSPAPCRCRHWADAVTRACVQLSLSHASSRPATLRSSPSPRDEGVSVTQCCNLFQGLNAALSNNAHSLTSTAATWWPLQISLHCHRPFPDQALSAWSSVGTALRQLLLKPNCGP